MVELLKKPCSDEEGKDTRTEVKVAYIGHFLYLQAVGKEVIRFHPPLSMEITERGESNNSRLPNPFRIHHYIERRHLG